MDERSTSPTNEREEVSLFPLHGTLLLPGTFLPLNVFEPRYRQLVRHVMEGDRRIGMIQPCPLTGSGQDLRVADPARPPLYGVGCLGEVVECEPQDDGRFLIVLRGDKRFRVVKERPLDTGGYRRVLADLSSFAADEAELEQDLDIGRLLTLAVSFCASRELEFDMELLGALQPVQAVNALCAALPFSAEEKQSLLEAADPGARRDLLAVFLEMQVGSSWQGLDDFAPPTIN